MLQVINAGTGQSNATLTKVPNNILTGGFDYGGSLAITLKDLDALMQEAASLHMDMPLAQAAQAAYLAAAAKGVDGLDMTTVIRPMEACAGVKVRWPSQASAAGVAVSAIEETNAMNRSKAAD